ncbi:flagellar motor switch protein FliG [Aliiroseovarius sp. PTFE2010]|uniref:flagellar motor switch protein FliG n=1 Tax=Aliiroseovarius sp. PTFE2010 TaxID=3417190 RepID=UPI003CF417A4
MDGLPALGEPMGGGDAGFGAIPIPPSPPKVSKKQKAAIVVRLLLSEECEIKLDKLPEEMQVELTRQMTQMRYIDRETLRFTVEEFISELEAIGLSFPGGLEGALSVLDGTIAPETIARLRKQAGFSLTGDPWERIADMDSDKLLPILEHESIEVGAVLLSKLKVSKAADLLGRLPGPRARKISYAISLTGGIAPDVVKRIGISLSAQLDAQPAKAFSDGPVERIGAILNSSPATTRDDVLAGLEETDAAFADLVRKSIFTYANIATRVDPRDIPKVVRDVDQETLIKAMAGGTGDNQASTDYILSNMSQRMADGLREEMAAVGKVKEKDAEDAMAAVVAAVRALEADGDIFLIADDE